MERKGREQGRRQAPKSYTGWIGLDVSHLVCGLDWRFRLKTPVSTYGFPVVAFA